MSRRKKRYPHRLGTPGTPWPWSSEVRLNNRNVVEGTRLRFKGERGEFTFLRYVEHPNGDWIDAFDKSGQFRAIRADRLKTVKADRKGK